MFRRFIASACLVAVAPLLACAAETVTNDVATELNAIREQLQSLGANLTKTVERVGEQETQIGQLRSQLTTLTDQINEEIHKQQQILDAISQTDSTGRHVPKLNAAMQSDTFRKEMQRAVNDSLDTSGHFRISNKTAQYQTIQVNRTDYGIGVGETLTLKVPVGTVTTQVPGRESRNWTVAAPTYEQNIEIVPTSTPTTTYLPAPAYVPRTVYYGAYPFTGATLYYWP